MVPDRAWVPPRSWGSWPGRLLARGHRRRRLVENRGTELGPLGSAAPVAPAALFNPDVRPARAREKVPEGRLLAARPPELGRGVPVSGPRAPSDSGIPPSLRGPGDPRTPRVPSFPASARLPAPAQSPTPVGGRVRA